MSEFIKKRKIIILLAVMVAIAALVAIRLRSNGELETASPVVGDLVRTVKISGKVTPKQSVELGFETSGIVTSIVREVGQAVRRGDLLARIDASGISSNVLKAEAELALAKAELDKLDGAGVYEAQIENAKRTLIQTIVDTYTASDDAVHNKTDQIFIDPRASRLEIVYAFGDHYDLRNFIVETRVTMDETLDLWESLIRGLNASTYTENHLSKSKKYLSDISLYITNVAQAVNLFESSSSLSQATIDTYKSDALSARDSINSSSQSLITTEDKLRNLLLEVPAQIARVDGARASLLNYQSQLSKTALISPIDGVVSRQESKIGQVVSSNTSLVSIISKEFEIEAFIPEVLISGVRIENPASVTLDAYGDRETFEAKIVHVDPAETVRDGVSTYKVKLVFNNPDDRIRSGMTANINIETFRKEGVKLIHERAVLREGNENFVYILSGAKRREKVAVEIGERDSMGNVELISNLPQESKLIINPDND